MSGTLAHAVTVRAAADAALERAAATLLVGVPESLAGPVRYALAGDGKRLRPILCVAAYRALQGPAPDTRIHDLAAALEIIHTYSLVHDDLPCMDDDELRRGRPTTHRAFDVRTATVAGAFMIPLAFTQLRHATAALALPAGTRVALARELGRAAGAAGMVGGQWLDLDAEATAGSIDELETMHRRKTGALMEAALAMGALAAGAEERIVAHFRDAGTALGLAFQIHDDVLDETASEAVLGKTAGKDRAHGKATFPALLGLEEARARARAAAASARGALRHAGVEDSLLDGLVSFAVERDR